MRMLARKPKHLPLLNYPKEISMQEDEATQVKTQTPSVGRIVHFERPDGQHAAACVCQVFSPEVVNLYVMPVDWNDLPELKTSVKIGDGPGTWHWPEYVP